MKENHSSDQGSYEMCEFTALNYGHIDVTVARAKRKQLDRVTLAYRTSQHGEVDGRPRLIW